MIKWLGILLAGINFFSFAWSVIGVFKKHPDQKMLDYRLLQIGSMATWAVSLTALYHSNFALTSWSVAMVCQVISAVLFWRCSYVIRQRKFSLAFSKDSPEFLQTSGPYRYVRHPFYTSYLLSYFGAFVATHSVGVLACCMLMLFIYIRAAKMEEGKFAASPLAADYEAYRKTTGMFFPKFSFGKRAGEKSPDAQVQKAS